ncbi:hypothetical protein [Allorhizobium borbori]|uniref:Uncharacterized protein n=1 Tax=Allorhizobium borbori TaxID=485907 RepID=A0A7W6JYI7_9HYPH|nr:hypothetical protein [Allorhizobium borbori]MBB4101861.1 hypothetical protein [Allorhizobium borbori]
MTVIRVLENGKLLEYGFDDLLRYHGFGFPGGVAHGFKVMQRAFPLLSPEAPPERREISVRTAFRGPGARDAFEMVTRAVIEDRYAIDASLEIPERGETLMRYVFELSYRNACITLKIREGHVRDEFILLGRKPERTPEEEERLTWLKQEMADRLLVADPLDVYETI